MRKRKTKVTFKPIPLAVTKKDRDFSLRCEAFASAAAKKGYSYAAAYAAFCGYGRVFQERNPARQKELIQMARVERRRGAVAPRILMADLRLV